MFRLFGPHKLLASESSHWPVVFWWVLDSFIQYFQCIQISAGQQPESWIPAYDCSMKFFELSPQDDKCLRANSAYKNQAENAGQLSRWSSNIQESTQKTYLYTLFRTNRVERQLFRGRMRNENQFSQVFRHFTSSCPISALIRFVLQVHSYTSPWSLKHQWTELLHLLTLIFIWSIHMRCCNLGW